MAKWPYNTQAWRKVRKMVLAREPVCRSCLSLGIITEADTVDHIEPVQDRPDLAFDMSNLQPLCRTCHSAWKQKVERKGVAVGSAVDGTPLDPGHHWNG